MDNGSLVFNESEDFIQRLLSASKSSSLEESLETLIETSKSVNGRAELTSKNILPMVLKLIESLHNLSSRQHLMLCLKLLRNLCAGEIFNQSSFIKQNGVEILSTILSSLAVVSHPDYGIIRMGLQVLANVSLAGEDHQQAIWHKFFPEELVVLARVCRQETCDPLCMVIFTCCHGRPELFADLCRNSGLVIMVEIIRTVSQAGYQEDWIKLLLSRTCLEDVHFPELFCELHQVRASQDVGDTSRDDIFSSEQAFLLRIISEILNERLEEISVPSDFALFVLEIFKRAVGVVDFASRGTSGLPTGSSTIDVLGYSITILRDVCALKGPGHLKDDFVDVVNLLTSSGLVELLLSLLRDLEPPAIIRKALNQCKNQEGQGSVSPKLCPYKGFRRDIVAVIGNCSWLRKHIQDEIRQKNGILLLLQQCVTDEDNPFLREWGIWCVRNILEWNTENQQAVADLELQGSVDVPELARLGLRVEVDPETQRAKLVNIPGKSPNIEE